MDLFKQLHKETLAEMTTYQDIPQFDSQTELKLYIKQSTLMYNKFDFYNNKSTLKMYRPIVKAKLLQNIEHLKCFFYRLYYAVNSAMVKQRVVCI